MASDFFKGAYWIGECPDCHQGRLVVWHRLAGDGLFLLCEECEAAWQSPEQVDLRTQLDFGDGEIALATTEMVERHGWHRYQPSRIL